MTDYTHAAAQPVDDEQPRRQPDVADGMAGAPDAPRNGWDPGNPGRTQPPMLMTAHNLPEDFWQRPSLAHIRQAARHRMVPPDALLNAVMAEVSACIDPAVRVDTGILAPLPLHHFAGIVGPSGAGKTTAITLAADVVAIQQVYQHDPDDDVPARWPLGSGQGIVEAYMGEVEIPPRPGKTKTERGQVRRNVLLHSDEGNDLVKAATDTTAIVGEVLRAMWSGNDVGQGNAKAENRRMLNRGTYTLATVVGFQLAVLGDFITDDELSKGTPQRFLFTYSVAPDTPVDRPDDPGRLALKLPTKTVELAAELRQQIREDHHARLTGATTLAPLQGQRPAMLARTAAILAIIDGRAANKDGRAVITTDDWQLAETMFATSLRIAQLARDHKQRKADQRREHVRANKVADALATHNAITGTDAERIQTRITNAIQTAGGRAHWTGKGGIRVRKFNVDERALADTALQQLIDNATITKTTNGQATWIELTQHR